MRDLTANPPRCRPPGGTGGNRLDQIVLGSAKIQEEKMWREKEEARQRKEEEDARREKLRREEEEKHRRKKDLNQQKRYEAVECKRLIKGTVNHFD